MSWCVRKHRPEGLSAPESSPVTFYSCVHLTPPCFILAWSGSRAASEGKRFFADDAAQWSRDAVKSLFLFSSRRKWAGAFREWSDRGDSQPLCSELFLVLCLQGTTGKDGSRGERGHSGNPVKKNTLHSLKVWSSCLCSYYQSRKWFSVQTNHFLQICLCLSQL